MGVLGGVVEDDEAFHSGGVRWGGYLVEGRGGSTGFVGRLCLGSSGVFLGFVGWMWGAGWGDGELATFGPWGLEELYWLIAMEWLVRSQRGLGVGLDNTAADYEASVGFGSGECEIEDFAADLGMVSRVLMGRFWGEVTVVEEDVDIILCPRRLGTFLGIAMKRLREYTFVASLNF